MSAIVEKVSHANEVNVVWSVGIRCHVLVSGSDISRIGTGQDLAHRVVSQFSLMPVLISNRLRLPRRVKVGIGHHLAIRMDNRRDYPFAT